MSELSPHDGIEEAFWRFHRENPRVWDELITLARSLKRRGLQHYGIGALFEVIRFRCALETTDIEFNLNNNHRALYARQIMEECDDLNGFFEIRERTTMRPLEDDYPPPRDPFADDPEPRCL